MEKYKKLKLLKFFLRYASELSIAPKAQNVSFWFFTLNSLKDTLSTIDCSELCLNSLYNWMMSNTLCSFCLWKEGSLDDSEEWWHQKTEENIYITCDALYKKRNDKRLYNTCICYAKSLQLCLTLCDPIDGSPPGFPVPGILQARTLEWVAISISNAWKWKVKVKSLSRVWPSATPWTAAFQAPPSMGFSRQEYWSGVPLPSLNTCIVALKEIQESIASVKYEKQG